jgi:hypothetical protein
MGVVIPLAVEPPTAVHVRFTGQDTAASWLVSVPEMLGVDWTCQPVASQRSASVRRELPSAYCPTAVQASSPEQETASSSPPATLSLG